MEKRAHIKGKKDGSLLQDVNGWEEKRVASHMSSQTEEDMSFCTLQIRDRHYRSLEGGVWNRETPPKPDPEAVVSFSKPT